MVKVIEQLNERRVTKPQSPTTQLIKDMFDVSLKDIEIIELKERNQLLREKLNERKENDPKDQEIAKLNEKILRLKEKVRGVFPLEGEKHLFWDELMKDI